MKLNSTKSFQFQGEFYDLKRACSKLVLIGLQFILLFVLVFAAVNTFAQAPTAARAIMTSEPQAKKLELVKQSAVVNGNKVYLNWIAKANAPDCIYVVERSDDQMEFEPVGLKEGIGSGIELLYSWVDNKPATTATQYRIKQIDNEGALMAQSDVNNIAPAAGNPVLKDNAAKTASSGK
jgi:hypothetical protein